MTVIIFLLITTIFVYCRSYSTKYSRALITRQYSHLAENSLVKSPYADIIPFLSEHIQKSDQLLVLGASSDLPIQLAMDGYGGSKTGYMLVVDSDIDRINQLIAEAQSSTILTDTMKAGKLKFQVADLTNMPQICKQSSFDAIVDYGALDEVLMNGPNGKENLLKCIDHLQNSLRLGNILVCLSRSPKEKFCSVFEERFGTIILSSSFITCKALNSFLIQ